MIKGFTGKKWWEQKNPAYRKACQRKHFEEMAELKGKYDYFIKITKENEDKLCSKKTD